MRQLKVFRDVQELVTLKKAAKKGGRSPKEKDLSVIKNGAFLTQGSKILWVGKTKDLKSSLLKKYGDSWQEYSLKNRTVMPAFVECHTHLIFGGDRSDEFEMRTQGASYQEIAQKGGGILSTVRATRKASAEKLLDLAQKRVNEFIKQGVTTIEVKSGYALDRANELKMLRVAKKLKKARIVGTYLGPHAIPSNYKNADDYLDFVIQKVLPQVAKENLASRVDMFIEKGYFNPIQAKRFFQEAQKYNFKVTAHVDQLTAAGGTKVACKMGAVSVDHAVHINDSVIKTLAQSETTAVMLPGADFYLKVKYPPARKLIDAGARVALATDFNPGSCPTQDLSLVGLLARHEMKMSLPEVITAYTVGAAHALDKGLELGSLEPGKFCDFTVLDGSWRELFYSVGHHPICETWSGGRQVKKT